jgi:alkanesulfonate monooxygenase SsuD/methylene tetrahydromethanopterin reductase-like flavin-dependent oxidoreductase (luciferase family)
MRFGLVLPIQAADTPLDVLLEELRHEVRAAEKAGFDAFFLPEFHQTRAGGLLSPALVGAALAEGTDRIRVGQAVLAGPLHHPVRLAEDMLMLSWLTRGRALLGLGAAHQVPDFALYGVDRARRFARLREALTVIRACFSGEPFDIHGERNRWAGQVTPRPYGDVPPEIWMGAHGRRSLALAGATADLWLAEPQRDVDTVARLAETYRSAAAEAGRTPRVGLFRDGWIGDSRAQCEAEWVPHALAVHRLYFNVGVYLPEFEPWTQEVADRSEFTVDRVGPGRFLYGSGSDIRGELTEWQNRTGCEYIALRMRQPGGPSHAATLEAIERFGAEVIEPLQPERKLPASSGAGL